MRYATPLVGHVGFGVVLAFLATMAWLFSRAAPGGVALLAVLSYLLAALALVAGLSRLVVEIDASSRTVARRWRIALFSRERRWPLASFSGVTVGTTAGPSTATGNVRFQVVLEGPDRIRLPGTGPTEADAMAQARGLASRLSLPFRAH